jgi:predicted DNA-binding WGR domain protein
MRRLTCAEEGSSKFWEAGVEGTSLTVRFGKIGTNGQTKVKTFASQADAEKELAKLVKEKLAKGYVDDAGAGVVAAAAPKPETKATKATSAKKEAAPAAKKKSASKARVLKYGFLDTKGAWIVAPRFENAGGFAQGLVNVCENGKWGYVDRAGSFVIPPTLTAAGMFSSHGFARVTRGYQIEDIDRSGAKVPMPAAVRGQLPFSEGLAPAIEERGGKKFLGYVDESRKWIVEPRYDGNVEAQHFKEGLAWVWPTDGSKGWVLVDRTGKEIARTSFDGVIGPFTNGFARVHQAGRYGYTDRTGALAIDLGEVKVKLDTKITRNEWFWGHPGTNFSEGHAAWTSDGQTFRIIDEKGNVVGEIAATSVGTFHEGLACFTAQVAAGERIGFVDTKGKVTIAPVWYSPGAFSHGVAYIQSDDFDYRFITPKGEVLVTGLGACGPFDDRGMAIATLGRAPAGAQGAKVGVLDRAGKWVIAPEFREIKPFVGNRAAASKDGKWGIVDRTGKLVVAERFDRMGTIAEDAPIAVNVGGVLRDNVFSGGKWGFIDAEGNEVVPLRFDAITARFLDGVAVVGTYDEQAVSEDEAKKFPFLFYGRRPADWAEGANCGHAYKIKFISAPDTATRARAHEAFAKRADGTQVDTSCGPWKWEDAWALVIVGEQHVTADSDERDDEESGTDWGEFFSDVARAFEAVHAVAPIAEVVSLNARATSKSDEWEEWTLRLQPRPSKGPSFGRVGFVFGD